MKAICQHFVSGSQATGVDKGLCTKPATRRVLDFAMYDLVNPAVCGRHGVFWERRGYRVIAVGTRIVFLDIDGVLNRCDTRSDVSPSTTEPLPIPIEPLCMARLNRLIAETGAKIVISSSWRLFARWEDLGPALVRHGLVAEVIGETPDLPNNAEWLANWEARKGKPFEFDRLERGWEIAEWLAAHPEVDQFVILDDCSDMAELTPWLVLTHPIDGLDDPDVERAKWLLERSSGGLVKARERALGTGPQKESSNA